MNRTSLPVQIQHDAGKFWGIIILTRSCKMLPFEHDLVWKVRQMSTSNSSELLMWNYPCKIMKQYWQFLQSYCVHKAAWSWASLKVQKGHTKVNVELVRHFDVEKIPIKLQHDTGNLWRVITLTRYPTPRQRQYPSSLRGWGVKIS